MRRINGGADAGTEAGRDGGGDGVLKSCMAVGAEEEGVFLVR